MLHTASRILLYFCVILLCKSVSVKAVDQDKTTDACKPQHVHLSYGDTDTDMVVVWTTQSQCSSDPPQVQYGIGSPWNLHLVVDGVTKDLTGCGGRGGNCSDLSFVHRVVLKELSPSSTVYYRPISGGVSTGPFYFHVPGKDESKPLRFIITSRANQGSQDVLVKSLQQVIYQQPYSALFLVNSPQQLMCTEKENALTQMEQLTTNLPLMIGADAEEDKECSQGMFSMPGHSWGKTPNRKRWYSFDVGMVHFIVYSSKVFLEKDPSQGKAMQTWMVEDLTKVNKKRSQTPWIIAVGSDPMYCQQDGGGEGMSDSVATSAAGRDCARNDSRIRHGLEDIFYSFAVDLVLELQADMYERTWPHYKNVKTSQSYRRPASPVEVVLAGGMSGVADENDDNGGGVGGVDGTMEDVVTNNTGKGVKADWTAKRFPSGADTYGHISVANVTHLHFEWRQATTSSSTTGKEIVLDEFWLIQEQHGNFSLSTLPHNVSHKINQSIIAMGGKPGTYDFISTLMTSDQSEEGEGWSKYSIWLGLGLVAVAIVLGLGVATIRSYLRRRRSNAGRRWREVDRQGGDSSGHFYSMASDSDSDGENDRDFEIDMFERSGKSESKLLTSY